MTIIFVHEIIENIKIIEKHRHNLIDFINKFNFDFSLYRNIKKLGLSTKMHNIISQ